MGSSLPSRNTRSVGVLSAGVLAVAGVMVPAPSAQAAPAYLSITFDKGIGAQSLGSALAKDVRLRVRSANRGSLQTAAGAEGSLNAVRTPVFNDTLAGPRAIIGIDNIASRDVLTPGLKDVYLQAEINLDKISETNAPGSYDDGDNIVQRGLSGSGAQYKIQVDRRVASCKMSGSAGDLEVSAPRALEGGLWYRMSCVRQGSNVTLRVRQYVNKEWKFVSETTRSGAIGAINFERRVPLAIGGKLNGDGSVAKNVSDPFTGRYSNILVRIG